MLRGIIKFFLNLYYSIFFRIEIKGKENLPKSGAYIIAPKHISNNDAPLMVAKIKRNDIYILAKQELFVNGFVKYLAKKTHVLPVNRGGHDTSTIKESLKILKENHALVIFPEGTRKGIEKNNKIHKGAIVIADTLGVPIIPVGINSTFKLFSKVRLNYGKPIEYERKKLSKEEMEEEAEKLKNEIIMLTNSED